MRALFKTEPIGVCGALEATEVYRFCSDHCREEFRSGLSDDEFIYGEDQDYLDGQVCDECGDENERPKA